MVQPPEHALGWRMIRRPGDVLRLLPVFGLIIPDHTGLYSQFSEAII